MKFENKYSYIGGGYTSILKSVAILFNHTLMGVSFVKVIRAVDTIVFELQHCQ